MLQRVISAWALVCVVGWFSVVAVAAQQPAAPAQQAVSAKAEPEVPRVVLQTESTASVLRLMKFSGALRDRRGNPRTGAVGLTFALYKDQQGGAPLWLEVHNAQLDEQGRYTVLLGSTKSEGLPLELFSSGEARWLGVQAQLPDEEEEPRVLLVSVPYALKAADAETLGGKPPSAFLLAEKAEGRDAAEAKPEAGKEAVKEGPPREGVVGPIAGEGSLNMVAKFTGPNNIGNGSIFDNGFVGIGTASPTARLHIFEPEPTQNANVRLMGSGQTGSWMDIFAGTAVGFGLFGYGAQPFIFGTGAVERMRITPTGEVGLGTTSPNARLSVGSGSIVDASMPVQISTGAPGTVSYYGANKNGGYGLLLGYENAGFLGTGGVLRMVSPDPLMFFVNNTTEAMRITSTGKVGIGTASPEGLLSLHSAGANVLRMTNPVINQINSGTIDFLEGTGTFGTDDRGFRLTYNGSTNRLRIQSGDFGTVLEPMSIGRDTGDVNFTADVGIGTTVPAARLHVQGVQPVSSTGTGTAASDGLLITGGKGGNTTGVGFTAGRGADMSLTAGIGGDAVAGSTRGSGGDITLNPGAFGGGAGTGGIYGSVNLATNSGRVGVGSSSPVTKLQVTGGSAYLSNPLTALWFKVKHLGATANRHLYLASEQSAANFASLLIYHQDVATPPDFPTFAERAFRFRFDGEAFAVAYNTGGADLAEKFPDFAAGLKAGDVVALDTASNILRLVASSSPYQENVMGIVSEKPGLLLAGSNEQRDEAPGLPLALSGRVPVKVTLENGPIQAGDQLTSSSRPGYAMKATKSGRVIGMALESFGLKEGAQAQTGKIVVFVNPHHWVNAEEYRVLRSEVEALKSELRLLRAHIKQQISSEVGQ